MLRAISPVDGRYADAVRVLQDYFSEYALIRGRVQVEVAYFSALCQAGLAQLAGVAERDIQALQQVADHFSEADALTVKGIEKTTNHDVKAVEYFLKSRMDDLGLGRYREFVHFGLTSQDVNNTAMPLLFKKALLEVYQPQIESLLSQLKEMGAQWALVPMLARTHGQPASPTLLGKEIRVFADRLEGQMNLLMDLPHRAKFGGATGNFNAHYAAYPDVDWADFADRFVGERLGLERSQTTTQIEPYDHLGAQLHGLLRINTVLIDLCRDMWAYISMDYFRQRVIEGEVGSSAMPHKVNPIDFENAEGNLGLANAIFGHLAEKLPVSRLQRDLTDSTVMRNLGVPFAHTLIALRSVQKGLYKLQLNTGRLVEDLERNWMVVAEGIQVILRREGYPNPYEALKALTRGQEGVDAASLRAFIEGLDVEEGVKAELRRLTPHNYVGKT
jgi:adenylosuccinate lyase